MLPTLKLEKKDDMIKMLRQYAQLLITANKSSHNKVLSPGRVPLAQVEIQTKCCCDWVSTVNVNVVTIDFGRQINIKMDKLMHWICLELIQCTAVVLSLNGVKQQKS